MLVRVAQHMLYAALKNSPELRAEKESFGKSHRAQAEFRAKWFGSPDHTIVRSLLQALQFVIDQRKIRKYILSQGTQIHSRHGRPVASQEAWPGPGRWGLSARLCSWANPFYPRKFLNVFELIFMYLYIELSMQLSI